MYRYNRRNSRPRATAGNPACGATPRLLDQMRECIRYKHYSLRTEKAYLFWVRRFIRFHALRHPKTMGAPEVELYLTHLATVAKVSPSTHKQALAAILFLYREVLCDRPALDGRDRPAEDLAACAGGALARRSRRGAGLRAAGTLAALRAALWRRPAPAGGPDAARQGRRLLPPRDLRARWQGGKDRVVMLPAPTETALRAQVRALAPTVGAGSRRRRARCGGALCAGAQAGPCGGVVFLALAVSGRRAESRSAVRHYAPTLPVSADGGARTALGSLSRGHHEAGDGAHPAAFLRHAPAGFRRGHPPRAGAAGSLRREHDDDLHACAFFVRGGAQEPNGTAAHAGNDRCLAGAPGSTLVAAAEPGLATSHAPPAITIIHPSTAGTRSTPSATTPASSTSAGAIVPVRTLRALRLRAGAHRWQTPPAKASAAPQPPGSAARHRAPLRWPAAARAFSSTSAWPH